MTAAFTKEALRKVTGPLEGILGRSSEARAGTTGGGTRQREMGGMKEGPETPTRPALIRAPGSCLPSLASPSPLGRNDVLTNAFLHRGERRFEKPARRDGGMRVLNVVASRVGRQRRWGSQVEGGGELLGVSSFEVHPCLLFVSPVPVRSGFEEGGAGPRKEHARSDSENWRSLREEQEDDGSWRLGAGPRRDGDRWRSTSPGKMGARWGSRYPGNTREEVPCT